MRRVSSIAGPTAIALLALTVAGCVVEKSENPLSPSLAGPLPGVAISAPVPVSPTNNALVMNTAPVQLVFNNSVSNSPRGFWYRVELAGDASFSSILYRNERVSKQDGTQTTFVLDSQFAVPSTYYWRLRAEDGANSSDFSSTAQFVVSLPIVIGAPVPVSPIGGVTTSTTTPDLVVQNGSLQGSAAVEYRFEISRNPSFAQLDGTVTVARSGGATTSARAPSLTAGTLFYWRVGGYGGGVDGSWSLIDSFRTPGGTSGGGGGGGGLPPPPPSSGGNRTPDPGPGQMCTDSVGNPKSSCLPVPNMQSVVSEVAAQYPGALQNSCQEHGGSFEFLDRVVDRLREYDTRWGYNWKRGNVGDPSLDAVAWHHGPGPDEGSPDVHVIDIISGHCGPNPSAGWGDVTDFFGAGAKWTGRGRF